MKEYKTVQTTHDELEKWLHSTYYGNSAFGDWHHCRCAVISIIQRPDTGWIVVSLMREKEVEKITT